MKKCYSIDGEEYNKTELSDVFDSLDCEGNLTVGHSYHEADAGELAHGFVITKYQIGAILENLDDVGHELIGEVFDPEYSSVSNEAKTELHDLLLAWAEKHVNISRYYFVTSSVEKFVTEGDIDEHRA